MDSKNVFSFLIIYIAYIAILIGASVLAALLTSAVVPLFTDDANIMVIAILTCIWLAQISTFLLRNRYILKRKLKGLETESTEKQKFEKRNLKQRQAVSTVLFVIIMGIFLFNFRVELIQQLGGRLPEGQDLTISESTMKILKYIFAGVLISMIIFKRITAQKQ